MTYPSKDSAHVIIPKHIPQGEKAIPSGKPERYINRELSWLEFNARVLAEASNPEVPLYERLKFLAIYSSNLDEFFMVRAAGLQAQILSNVHETPADGLTAEQQLEKISQRAHELCAFQCDIWNNHLHPALREVGLAVLSTKDLSESVLEALDKSFESDLFPVLTPIAIDPAHPFPHIRNKALNVCILFATDSPTEPAFGLVQLPSRLPRLVPVIAEGYRRAFVTLEELIFRHVRRLFPHLPAKGHFAFRVTRNFDIELDEDEGEDLLLTVQAELRRRERGHAVRLEIAGPCPDSAKTWLCDELSLLDRDLYELSAPLMLETFAPLTKRDERSELSDPPFSPIYVPPLRDSDDFFQTIRKGDVLLHHPYESFEAVIDFVNQAAEDPNVLAIKQTLYRTGGESPLVRALQRAAELGKQVTAVVELKARFDEESNIQWAHALERSGVNVMYGLLGFKTHAKVLLVVRKEGDRLMRYVHLATGNYNQQTARLYEDISLLTARESLAEDAGALFNLLTGYSAPDKWNELITAPLGLHEAVLGLIHRERIHALDGKPARIIAKLNALVDADVIDALYMASEAGVKVDLLVRGICCLRPGMKGLSENVRVHAVVDRFLEHARILYFENAGEYEVYCSSADWMPRNFRRRVEVMFPVLDPDLKARLYRDVLEVMAADNVKGWVLGSDGRYTPVSRDETPAKGGPEPKEIRSQEIFISQAKERSLLGTPTLRSQEIKPGEPESPIGKLRHRRKKKK
jgi:polyphosphate kinase